MTKNYKIDTSLSDNENLIVDVPGVGSINILVKFENIVVRIYPEQWSETPAATCEATFDEIVEHGESEPEEEED